MGGGVSSLARLRKTLVIRAYNTRKKDQTIEDQFIVHSFARDGKTRIKIDDIKKALSVDAPWMDELFETLVGTYSKENEDIEFDHFIGFLETGQYVPEKDTWEGEVAPNVKAHGPMRTQSLRSKAPPPIAVNYNMPVGLPPTPPGQSSFRGHFQDKENSDNFKSMPVLGEESSVTSDGDQRVRDALEVPRGGMEVALRETGGLQVPVDVKAMWRKSEIVKQERIVSYTTIDAAGLTQELMEKECTQTEVLHMECRETGEFAHRETTTFEQVETFNNETVAEESGKEEYVHLKSLDDEFEYMDSNMPQGRSQQQQQQPQDQMPDGPQSPRVQDGDYHEPANGGHYDEHVYEHGQGPAEEADGDDLSMKGSISPMQTQSPQAFPLGGDGTGPVGSPTNPHYAQNGMASERYEDEAGGPMFYNEGSPTKVNGGMDMQAAAEAFQAGQLTEEEMAAIYAQAQAEALMEMEALAREEALLAAQEDAEAHAFKEMRAAQQQTRDGAAARGEGDEEGVAADPVHEQQQHTATDEAAGLTPDAAVAVEELNDEDDEVPTAAEEELDFADID